MAARGSGPSRRSHTKSRKGCRTCKRRHIRCDESFPQCRNCTKHHVRCDYMDATTPDSDSISTTSSVRTSPTPTPINDEAVGANHFSSEHLYHDLDVTRHDLALQTFGPDPQLIRNLYDIVDNLDAKGASDLTACFGSMRRFLALATSSPYLLDSLKAFSAGQLAWATQSPVVREQALSYASSAITGLHQAVGQFDQHNADAVLATSILLCTQSRDHLSWSSLISGLQSIATAMSSWQHQSAYPDLIKVLNTVFDGQREPSEEVGVSVEERAAILARINQSLHALRPYLTGRAGELHWINQFIDLVQRLQTTQPAKTPEEGFNHLYVLRKWVHWLPVLLLQEGPVDMLKLSVIAHLYAMPLAIGHTFPRMRGSMCGNTASVPLLNVLARMQAMQEQMPVYDQVDYTALMSFPHAALDEYNNRNPWSPARPQPVAQFPDISMFVTDESEASGGLSPAFAPSNFTAAHSRASSATSLYLEVPTPSSYTPQQLSFGQSFSQWGTFPSPSFPSQDFYGGDDLLFDEEQAKTLSSPFGNFNQPCEIWT